MKQISFFFACVLYCSVCIAQDEHSGHAHYEKTKQALMDQTRFVFGIDLEKLNDEEISQLAKNLVSVADKMAKTPEIEKHIERVWSNNDPKSRINHISKCPLCYSNIRIISDNTKLQSNIPDKKFSTIYALENTYFNLDTNANLFSVIDSRTVLDYSIAKIWLNGNKYEALRFSDNHIIYPQPALELGNNKNVKITTGTKVLQDVVFLNEAGNSVKLSGFQGRVALVHFWASWCSPCIKELPALSKLQAHFPTKNFIVIPISIDLLGKNAVNPVYKKLKIDNLGIYLDAEAKAFNQLSLVTVPSSFLVNSDGLIKLKVNGSKEWNEKSFVSLVSKLINEK